MNLRFLEVKYMPYELLHFLIKEKCLSEYIDLFNHKTERIIKDHKRKYSEILSTLYDYRVEETIIQATYFMISHYIVLTNPIKEFLEECKNEEERKFWEEKEHIYKLYSITNFF